MFRCPWRPEASVRAKNYRSLMWVLGTEPRPSERATAEPSLQPHLLHINTVQDPNPGSSATHSGLVPISANVIELIPTVIPRGQSDLDNPYQDPLPQVVPDCLDNVTVTPSEKEKCRTVSGCHVDQLTRPRDYGHRHNWTAGPGRTGREVAVVHTATPPDSPPQVPQRPRARQKASELGLGKGQNV